MAVGLCSVPPSTWGPRKGLQDLQGTWTRRDMPALVTQQLPAAAKAPGSHLPLQDKVSPWQGDTRESDPTLGRAVVPGPGMETPLGYRAGSSGHSSDIPGAQQ